MQEPPTFIMPIITSRIIIRPIESSDAKMINDAILESYDQLKKYMNWADHIPVLEETQKYALLAAENWISKKNDEPYLQLVIIDINTHDFIGSTSFHHYDWDIPSIETGFWIREKYSGQGFMTEAINAVTQYAFNHLKVKRIALTCDPDNIKSTNIAKRLSYTLEGRLKNHRLKPDTKKLGDTLIYAKYNLSDLPLLKIKWG